MSIIVCDFETYYDKDYSLSKMMTEEYIKDPRFEVIGVGIKVDDEEAEWYSDNIYSVLQSFDWKRHEILCHNTLFDGAILSWKYDVKPKMWFDTLSMAWALHGTEVGGSLKALALRYGLGEKGDEVVFALGKKRVDFDAISLERYGAYCLNDVDLTYKLFKVLSKESSESDLNFINLGLRRTFEK